MENRRTYPISPADKQRLTAAFAHLRPFLALDWGTTDEGEYGGVNDRLSGEAIASVVREDRAWLILIPGCAPRPTHSAFGAAAFFASGEAAAQLEALRSAPAQHNAREAA
jgi:hypothetical protein